MGHDNSGNSTLQRDKETQIKNKLQNLYLYPTLSVHRNRDSCTCVMRLLKDTISMALVLYVFVSNLSNFRNSKDTLKLKPYSQKLNTKLDF